MIIDGWTSWYNSPERMQILKDYEAGAPLTGKGGIRQRLGAIDMEFFGRAYFPHYFSRPSPEFHRELDNIWQQGVLKGEYPITPAKVKQISRMNGTKRVVAAPRGHAKSTSLTFKGSIHAIVYEYKHYPIIISDSSEQAEGFLDNIRVEFEENEALREDFGNLVGKVWRSNVLITSTNINQRHYSLPLPFPSSVLLPLLLLVFYHFRFILLILFSQRDGLLHAGDHLAGRKESKGWSGNHKRAGAKSRSKTEKETQGKE